MATDTSVPRSRRALLGAAAGAAAATVVGAVAGAQPAAASTQFLHLVNDENIDTVISGKSKYQPGYPLSGDGIGVYGSSSSYVGVYGVSDEGEAVIGISGLGTGVHGVAGHVDSPAKNYPCAVLGEANLPTGGSVLGNNYADSGIAVGTQGTSDSPKGMAAIGWARSKGTGVVGISTNGQNFPTASVPANTGVYGKAATGRGGVFAGGKAQLRLVPSAAATHPLSGVLGDLFLDKSGRLWFCKSGTHWKQIA